MFKAVVHASQAMTLARRRGRSVILLTMACVFFLVAACAETGSRSNAVYFSSDRSGDFDIFIVDTETGDARNLTDSPGDDRFPVASPDGKLIAYVANVGADEVIRVLDPSGDSSSELRASGSKSRDPRWSPVGDRIALIRFGADSPEVYTAKIDGSTWAILSRLPGDEVGDWSRNGESIVFAIHDGPAQGLYVRNPDGVNEFRLTDTPDRNPVWSPDSKRIAFISSRDGNDEVYVMNGGGGGLVRITETDGAEYDLSWSPDGKKLMFVSERDGNAEIYVAAADGSAQTRLTFNQVRDIQPAWSPNGRRIAFVSYMDGDAEIFLMNADGSSQTRLTSNDAEDIDPGW
ncbi:MAG: hypothetical protein FJ317_00470 [SAR202 cluster bacterium]|nr:hypothetical protein [SAR202 cluster bacterium]